MMKHIKYLVLSILIVIGFASCNYLDVVPDEVATEDDAFATVQAAENFLYSCYSYIPNPRSGTGSIDWFTGDEIVTAFEHETFAHFPKGNYTALNPIISYWNTLFSGIKQCYMLINNIDKTPNLDQSLKDDYVAQAEFLIAYYHFLLVRNYGPVILIKEEPQLNTAPEDFLARSPYDGCIDWIATKFDESAARLPETRPSDRMGLATSVAAKSIKARMLLYAASPLFNGNSMYSDFKNPDGTNLMNLSYDVEKWVEAKNAAKAAIDAAEAVGHRLYQPSDANFSDLPEPSDHVQRGLRFTLVDKSSKEHIWIDARGEGFYSLQNKSRPFYENYSWNGISPTLAMLDRFYTKNGLPVDEDPEFNFDGRFSPAVFTEDDPNGEGQTQTMNLNREPRYYAWISFHGGYYESTGNYNRSSGQWAYAPENLRGIDNKKVLTRFTRNETAGIRNRANNYSPTGFLNKKGVHPASNSGVGHREYPWPVVRLGELYLNYAEACVETGDLDEARIYLNKIRERAGIPTVEESWGSIGVSLTRDKLREIVRQERMVEMYMEHQNFWDMRRWLLAEEYFTAVPEGNNIMADQFTQFAERTPLDGREVPGGNAPNITREFNSPRNYLMPIPYSEVQKNKNLVQNPGY